MKKKNKKWGKSGLSLPGISNGIHEFGFLSALKITRHTDVIPVIRILNELQTLRYPRG